MILKGKYGEAKVFTDMVEETAQTQIIELMNQPYMEGRKVRIMPDVHAGKGCVIGTTFEVGHEVSPSLVGVDIGCGVLTVRLGRDYFKPEELDKIIREKIPAGHDVRGQALPQAAFFRKAFHFGEFTNRDELSLGTLGGGEKLVASISVNSR